MELSQTLAGQILAQSIAHVLLGEEDMHALETGIIGGHAVVLQAGDGVHTLLGHTLLCEHDGELLGTVIAVVEEDDHIAFLDGAIHSAVVDGLHELVGHALIVTFLHSLHHVGSLLALCTHEQIVGNLHSLPALIAVHGVETAYHTGDSCTEHLCAVVCHLLDKVLAALGVGIAAVHEAVYIGVLNAVSLADVEQCEQVVK